MNDTTLRWWMIPVCIINGHRYDPTIMQVQPIPMIHCDRCGTEF